MTTTVPAPPSRFVSAVRGLAGRRRFREVRTYCMFVGYPRSGHSLLGSLIDAHPRAVVAHELDALALIAKGYGRLGLFEAIMINDARFTASGRQWFGYDYRVSNQWQGRYDVIEVIGDKKGAVSTEWLERDPQLLDQLRSVVEVPVRLIHHVRNPYDNIATMALRVPLDAAVVRYLRLCAIVQTVVNACDPSEVLEIHHEALISEPKGQLALVCDFLGLTPTTSYLDDCAGIVFPDARRTRDQADWTPQALAQIEEAVTTYPFLSGYEQ